MGAWGLRLLLRSTGSSRCRCVEKAHIASCSVLHQASCNVLHPHCRVPTDPRAFCHDCGLCVVQGVAPAAEQWELSWQGLPTDGHWRTAASILPRLSVNPVGAGLPEAPRKPPLLLAPLKVTLCAGHVRLGVCLDESPATHAAASMLQDSSVLVDIRDLKVT